MDIELIVNNAIEKYGSFRKFCMQTGQDESNFKRKLERNLKKVDNINKSIKPLGLTLKLTKK